MGVVIVDATRASIAQMVDSLVVLRGHGPDRFSIEAQQGRRKPQAQGTCGP